MKRLRAERWSGQLLSARPTPPQTPCFGARHQPALLPRSHNRVPASIRRQSAAAAVSTRDDPLQIPLDTLTPASSLPSPPPSAAHTSAKLSALHARLSLPRSVPLETLARTLIDASADPNPQYNNTSLAFLGRVLTNYHICEWLLCRFPRLPMEILYAAMRGYGGNASLGDVARSWGVERAADPGGEVDAGLLQFVLDEEKVHMPSWGYVRPEAKQVEKFGWRRGMGSRVVMDDDFGELVEGVKPRRKGEEEGVGVKAAPEAEDEAPDEDTPEQRLKIARELTMKYPNVKNKLALDVHGNMVHAVVGAIYTHCGREVAKAFVKSHILSRQLDIESLFVFGNPTRELARLCGREEFEKPAARLLSETGRMSRTPVFVVGIFSGEDKLGEGAASSLNDARNKAAINALKSWYLYSPGERPRVPSDMTSKRAEPWEPVYVDIGEIV